MNPDTHNQELQHEEANYKLFAEKSFTESARSMNPEDSLIEIGSELFETLSESDRSFLAMIFSTMDSTTFNPRSFKRNPMQRILKEDVENMGILSTVNWNIVVEEFNRETLPESKAKNEILIKQCKIRFLGLILQLRSKVRDEMKGIKNIYGGIDEKYEQFLIEWDPSVVFKKQYSLVRRIFLTDGENEVCFDIINNIKGINAEISERKNNSESALPLNADTLIRGIARFKFIQKIWETLADEPMPQYTSMTISDLEKMRSALRKRLTAYNKVAYSNLSMARKKSYSAKYRI